MTEPAFREIQLSTKQLVFLFMSAVVILVVAFLLGVQVGRGVGADPGLLADTSTSGDTLVPAEVSPTDTALGEPGVTTGAEERPPATVAAEQPDTSLPAAPPPPEPDPPAAAAPPPPVTDNPPMAGGDWVLQVGAFGSLANANALVARLTARGYAAFRQQTDSSSTPFAVRVGPFTSRAQAEVSLQRLASEPEGYKPLIIR